MEPTQTREHRAIIITGPVGSGKSTTAAELRELLGRSGRANILFDMDYLRSTYPDPIDDPFAANLGYRVLADAWKHVQSSDYGDAGPLRTAILADIVETREQRIAYETALPNTEVVIVRLVVAISELLRRLELRESEHTIDWYRHRAPELQRIMDEAGIGDILIEVEDRDAREVAAEIAHRLALIPEQKSIVEDGE